VLTGAVVQVANRPALTRYVRIDDAGRAQAIQYSDLNYSPREGEIRTYLTDWANYRHTINRETIAKKYPMNYYFLSSQLASQLINTDNNNHLTTQVIAGQIEQNDIQVNNVTITSMTQERISGAIVSRGTALMTFDLIYSPSTPRSRVQSTGWPL
jgi:type IV secretion system protein VirB5